MDTRTSRPRCGATWGMCPVVHADFSAVRTAGELLADRQRIPGDEPDAVQHDGPGLLDLHRSRAVRECTATRTSSRASRSRRGSPNRSTASSPRRSIRPITSNTARSSTPGSRPGRSPAPSPRPANLSPPGRRARAAGRCDFVTDFALRYPTEVFLTVIGCPAPRGSLRAVGRGLLPRFGGEPTREGDGRGARGIRDYWVHALAERRGEPEPRPGDLASYLMHASFDDGR